MWDMIKFVALQNSEKCVCVVGDYNAIKEENERVGRAEFTDQRGIRLFQEFIELSNLIDLPLRGHSYTWYRPDGSCKSRLDRLLVNDQWLLNWLNATPSVHSEYGSIIVSRVFVDRLFHSIICTKVVLYDYFASSYYELAK
ncbi:hypothetical protein ACS0TY_036319 [Phlomoides rotata]